MNIVLDTGNAEELCRLVANAVYRDLDDYKVAFVKLDKRSTFVDNSKHYAFKMYDNLEVGDRVLVNTVYGYQVGKIKEIKNRSDMEFNFTPTQDIICKLNFDDYNNREVRRKKKELVQRIADMQEQLRVICNEEDNDD